MVENLLLSEFKKNELSTLQQLNWCAQTRFNRNWLCDSRNKQFNVFYIIVCLLFIKNSRPDRIWPLRKNRLGFHSPVNRASSTWFRQVRLNCTFFVTIYDFGPVYAVLDWSSEEWKPSRFLRSGQMRSGLEFFINKRQTII